MADDELWKTLMRFHREIVRPDIEQIVDERIVAKVGPFMDRTNANFDGVFKKLERLDHEYVAMNAALRRVEARLAAVDEKLDKMALRTELMDLKERVDRLQQRIDELQKHFL